MVDVGKNIVATALNRLSTGCCGPDRGPKLTTVRLPPVRLVRMVSSEVRIHLPINLRLHQHHPE